MFHAKFGCENSKLLFRRKKIVIYIFNKIWKKNIERETTCELHKWDLQTEETEEIDWWRKRKRKELLCQAPSVAKKTVMINNNTLPFPPSDSLPVTLLPNTISSRYCVYLSLSLTHLFIFQSRLPSISTSIFVFYFIYFFIYLLNSHNWDFKLFFFTWFCVSISLDVNWVLFVFLGKGVVGW